MAVLLTLLPLLLAALLPAAAAGSLPTVTVAASKDVSLSAKAIGQLSLSGNMSLPLAVSKGGVAPKGFLTCNTGSPPWPASLVVPGFEETGLASGVVLLYFTFASTGRTFRACSGTLIAPTLVATAASCVYDTDVNVWQINSTVTVTAFTRRNGVSDASYSTAFVSTASIFNGFVNAASFVKTLLDGSDIAVVKLSSPLIGQAFQWTSAVPAPFPRAAFGYPAQTVDGKSIVYDVTVLALSRGCQGYSANVLCEDLSVEGGMGGGPLVTLTPSLLAVGLLSAAATSSCPAYFTALVGTYSLEVLARSVGCNVFNNNGIFSALC